MLRRCRLGCPTFPTAELSITTSHITEANVKTRLLRARLQMRDALAPGIDGSWTTGRSRVQESSTLVLSGV